MEKVFEIYIRTTPERCGRRSPIRRSGASTTFGARVASDWTPGSRYEMGAARQRPTLLGEGENLEVDPPRRLVQTHRSRSGATT